MSLITKEEMPTSSQVFTTVVISGPSGVGKTTIGKWLARELGGPFVEGDDYHPAKNIQKMRSGSPLTDSDRVPWLERLHDEVVQRGNKDLWSEMKNSPYRCSTTNADQTPGESSTMGNERVPTAPPPLSLVGNANESSTMSNIHLHGKFGGYFTSTPSSDASPPVVVLACSALKRTYRDILRGDMCSKKNTANTSTMTGLSVPSIPSCVIFIFLDGDREILRRRLAQRTGHFMPPALLQSQLDALEFLKPDENGCVIDFSVSPEAIVREAKNSVSIYMKRPAGSSTNSVL